MTQIMKYTEGKEVKTLHCLRCGYEWNPKYPGVTPSTCGNTKCRSPNWMKPKSERKQYTWKNLATKEAARRKSAKELSR